MKIDKSSQEYEHRYVLGKFYTCDNLVCKIINLFNIDFTKKAVLEPSCGSGAFVNAIQENFNGVKITAIDIDPTVKSNYDKTDIEFICDDFLGHKFDEKFDVVIGNPPFNLKTQYNYYDTTEGFIVKSLELLVPDGDMLLVLPSTVLRNKQYQPVREYIVANYKIEAIMDTSNYDFLGADIETIVLHIKNTKVNSQCYFYINGSKKEKVFWTKNERCTLHVNNLQKFNDITKKIGKHTIGDLFEIHRGRGKIGKLIRGRDIDFYGCYYDNESLEKVIGIQNIAYRFAANVISSDLEKISDTVTLLVPKKEMSIKELIFYSEYLNTSIANYLIHCDALNDCKLTIHMDKYYIEGIALPEFAENEPIIENVLENHGDFVLAQNRNEIFYKILKLSKKEIACVEDKWTFPRYKLKSQKLLLEV